MVPYGGGSWWRTKLAVQSYLPAMLARYLLPALLLAPPSVTHSQDTLIAVYGTVRDYVTRQPITEALVALLDERDASERSTRPTNGLGRYELAISVERAYRVTYTAEGYYPKSVAIDATGPTAEEWVGGFGMNIDIMLLPEVDGMDLSFGGEPFGRASYVKESGVFEWDVAYTQAMQAGIRERMAAYRARMGMPEEVPQQGQGEKPDQNAKGAP